MVEPRYFDGHAKKVVPKPKRSRNQSLKKFQKKGGHFQRDSDTAAGTSKRNGEGLVDEVQDQEMVDELEGVTARQIQQGNGDCVAMMDVEEAEKTTTADIEAGEDGAPMQNPRIPSHVAKRTLPHWEDMDPENFDAVAMDWIINSEGRGVCIRKILNEYFDNPDLEIGEYH